MVKYSGDDDLDSNKEEIEPDEPDSNGKDSRFQYIEVSSEKSEEITEKEISLSAIDEKLKFLYTAKDITDPEQTSILRDIISAWIASNTNNIINDFGQKAEFLSAVETPFYSIVLRTQYEERTLGEGSEPYNIKNIPPKTITKENVDIWASLNPEKNESKMTRYKILNSSENRKCSECEGEGDLYCGDCDRTGKTDCSTCNGTGDIQCVSCQGRGEKDCSCSGLFFGSPEKRARCNICFGRGTVKCRDCRNGLINCKRCRGRGEITCSTCKGKGIVTCDNCEGEGEVVTFLYFDVLLDSTTQSESVSHPLTALVQNEKYSAVFDITQKEISETQFASLEFDLLKTTISQMLSKSRTAKQPKVLGKDYRIINQQLVINKINTTRIACKFLEIDYIMWVYGESCIVWANESPVSEIKKLMELRELLLLIDRQKTLLDQVNLIEKAWNFCGTLYSLKAFLPFRADKRKQEKRLLEQSFESADLNNLLPFSREGLENERNSRNSELKATKDKTIELGKELGVEPEREIVVKKMSNYKQEIDHLLLNYPSLNQEPEEQKRHVEKYKFCPFCHGKVKTEAIKCKHCKKELLSTKEDFLQEEKKVFRAGNIQKPAENKATGCIGCAIIVVLVLGLIGYFTGNNGQNKSTNAVSLPHNEAGSQTTRTPHKKIDVKPKSATPELPFLGNALEMENFAIALELIPSDSGKIEEIDKKQRIARKTWEVYSYKCVYTIQIDFEMQSQSVLALRIFLSDFCYDADIDIKPFLSSLSEKVKSTLEDKTLYIKRKLMDWEGWNKCINAFRDDAVNKFFQVSFASKPVLTENIYDIFSQIYLRQLIDKEIEAKALKLKNYLISEKPIDQANMLLQIKNFIDIEEYNIEFLIQPIKATVLLIVTKKHAQNTLETKESPPQQTVSEQTKEPGNIKDTPKIPSVSISCILDSSITLTGHADRVKAIAFSPDGKMMASGSADQTIKLWDCDTGSELKTLKGHSRFVTTVAFSPDGSMLASGSVDRAIRIWNVSTAEEIRVLLGHTADLTTVIFSPDGKLLASSSWDKTIRLWDIDSGKELFILSGHTGVVNTVAFSPDGQIIASGSTDKNIKLWNVATGEEIKTLSGHSDWINVLTFVPNTTTLFSGADNSKGGNDEIRMWDISTYKEIELTKCSCTDSVITMAFSSDGRILATGSGDTGGNDDNFRLWDIQQNKEIVMPLYGHKNYSIRAISFAQEGKILVAGAEGSTIRLWTYKK